MKAIFSLLAIFLVFNLSAQDCKPGKGDATVPQVQGIYVFTNLKPKRDYKFLGEVKTGNGFSKAMFSNDPQSLKIEKLVQKARKEFPETEAIIIRYSKDAADKADCIKFED